MNGTLAYTETSDLEVHTLAVIGAFNDFDPKKGQMGKVGNVWSFNQHLEPGEYAYRFLVNGVLELNDPTANLYYPDASEKLWSMLVIDQAGERLYNNTRATIHIARYSIHSVISEHTQRQKKNFNQALDSKVVTRFDFTKITGVHTITTAWFAPNSELFQIVESNVFKPAGQKEPIKCWFWLDLKDSTRQYPTGIWTIKLFINGGFILADHFRLQQTSLYSPQGRMK